MARRPSTPGASALREGLRTLADAEKFIEDAAADGLDALDQATEFRRLSPDELFRIGASPKARRYVPKSTKRVTKRTKTISHRKYETKKLGGLSREKATKLRERGKLTYKTPQAKATAEYTRQAAKVRAIVEGVTPRDVRLILTFKAVRWEGLGEMTEDDEDGRDYQQEFRQLFSRYDREEVLEALGSPETVTKRRAA